MMAQVVPAELGDPGALEKLRPRSLDARGDLEHSPFVSRLLSPVVQDTRCLVVERQVTGLPALRGAAFDPSASGEGNRLMPSGASEVRRAATPCSSRGVRPESSDRRSEAGKVAMARRVSAAARDSKKIPRPVKTR